MADLYPLSQIFIQHIEKIDSFLIPARRIDRTEDARVSRMKQETVSRWLDKLGQMSSVAQGLNRTITTGDKLRLADDQTVYIMCDRDANNGQGEIVGYLRAGPKSLYLYNSKSETVQVKPMCVLDFFVVPDRQRHGYGKMLFDYMLADKGLQPNQLAIDGPSPKLTGFMKKHYGIGNFVKQHNNFAVTPDFFSETRDTPDMPAAAPTAVGRFTARKPTSSIGNVIHGGHDKPNGQVMKAIQQESGGGAGGAGGAATPERPSSLSIENNHSQVPKQAAVEEEVVQVQLEELHIEPYPEEQKATESVVSESTSNRPRVSPSPSAAGSASRRDAQLTDQGYFDIKFYHSKLW